MRANIEFRVHTGRGAQPGPVLLIVALGLVCLVLVVAFFAFLALAILAVLAVTCLAIGRAAVRHTPRKLASPEQQAPSLPGSGKRALPSPKARNH